MVNYAFLTMAGLAAALPLNINLGAYSPALVVGDGEISFGGNQDVSSLINALEGAAVNAAAGARAEGNAVAPAQIPPAGEGVAPVTIAAADPNLQEQASQVQALQGMGKEIAPREETKAPVKRDLAGFDRALRFAEVGLTTGPKVQLGTGAEGSGVGIIVDNRAGVIGGAERPGGAAEKRDVDGQERPVRARVTTMYIRNTTPESLQPSNNVARDVSAAAAFPPAAMPVSRRDTIDSINLNLDANQGVTMTFIETVGDDEE